MLAAGVGMQKSCKARLEFELIVNQFSCRGQTIGGTTAAADDMVKAWSIRGVVYSHAQRDVWVLGSSCNQHFAGAGLEMMVSLMTCGRLAAGLNH